MSDTLIQVKGLNSYYGASHILRNIDFEVKRGETIGLMGRNGMGKSTLLKSIMGIVTPRSGDVHIKGVRTNDRAIFEVAQQGIAYVPERHGLATRLRRQTHVVPDRKASENIGLLIASTQAVSRDFFRRPARDVLAIQSDMARSGGQVACEQVGQR